MNESILLPVFIMDLQAGFKSAKFYASDLKTAERWKALNEIFLKIQTIETAYMSCFF